MLKYLPFLAGFTLLFMAFAAGPLLESTFPVQRAVAPPFLFGLHMKDSSFALLSTAERKIGRKTDLFPLYCKINDPFPQKSAERAAAGGYLLYLTLEFREGSSEGTSAPRYRLNRIAAGDFDRQMDRWAAAIKRYNHPVVLRTLSEFNGFWYPWGAYGNGNKVSDFNPAWRHVVERFRQAGASNVQFMLCYNRNSVAAPGTSTKVVKGIRPGEEPWSVFWPGDGFVDLIGIDGYNRPPDPWHHWTTFGDLYDDPYRRVTALTKKPLWIAEFASTGQGGDKATWIRDAFHVTATRYPRVRAMMWFNHAVDPTRDWDFDISAACCAAMRQGLSEHP